MQVCGRCGVLEQGFSLWVEQVSRAKGGQGGFVKAAQNEFLFAGVSVDVAHCKNTLCLCGISFCVDWQLLACHGQTPMADGA